MQSSYANEMKARISMFNNFLNIYLTIKTNAKSLSMHQTQSSY